MRRWLGPVLVVLACAAATHAATLHLAPGVIMDRAMAALAQRGVALHAFTTPERITPQTQSVVRSSPDLFYALCRYDLADPEAWLTLQMAQWPDYQSLSFFDARTNNFATIRGSGKLVTVRLLPPGSAAEPGAIVSPTSSGVILIRRLAPNAERFAAAAANSGDQCQLERGGALSHKRRRTAHPAARSVRVDGAGHPAPPRLSAPAAARSPQPAG